MFKNIFILVAGIGLVNGLAAQSVNNNGESVINQQIWIDFYPHYFVNKKIEYYGDSGFRTIIGERSWNRIYIRPSLKYHLNDNWEFHAGAGVFYIFYTQAIDQFEFTPWQGVQWNWNGLQRIKLKHLVRLEERWSYLTDEWNADFEFRLRYKFSGILKLRHKKWSMPFYGEIFLPLKGEIKELYQNKGRAGLGLSYKISKDWQLTFLFNWQRSKTGINEEVSSSAYIYQIKIKKVWRRLLLK